MESNKKPGNSTLLRGLTILKEVAQSTRATTVADLIDMLNIPKPTLHRIVDQLKQEGLLQNEPGNKKLIIGSTLKEFAFDVLSHQSIATPRHAILKALSEEINETCNCTMLDGDHCVYFDRVESDWPYRIDLKVGSHLPLHCTASGKLFLAHMQKKTRQQLICSDYLKRYTERTITDSAYLEDELKNIKNIGIGIDNEEFISGMVAIAVPVFDQKNKICFTVAAHAPSVRKSLEDLRQYIPSLKYAATKMTEFFCQK